VQRQIDLVDVDLFYAHEKAILEDEETHARKRRHCI